MVLTEIPTAQAIDIFVTDVSIINPENITYTTSSIPINVTTTTNGTNPVTTWNIQFSNDTWLYEANQTYTVATTATINENLTATFHAWANNTEGSTDNASVVFTVYIQSEPTPTPTPTATTTPETSALSDTTNYLVLLVLTLVFTVLALINTDKLWRVALKFIAGMFWMILAIAQFFYMGSDGFLMILSLPYAIFGMLFWFAILHDFLSEKKERIWQFED
ncbi:MAG: hypothetical protein WC325_09410 [Candidatus Bathyarchaeia archaeon]